jgi:hypothetical protein
MMAIDAICQRGSIRDSDVATLRRAFAFDTHIAATDIDGLFRAHGLARVQDPSWGEFFVETLTDYVVRELEPAGYVTAAHAGWLVARVSQAGRVRTKTEQDLLLNVIDKARWVPESLLVFALSQIRDAVITGQGPLRVSADPGPGHITLAEVEQIRALLFAYGTEGPTSITQPEAEMLLEIERAIATRRQQDGGEADLSPIDAWPIESWRDLLEKSLTSAVLSASGYAGPTREEAINEARPLTSWAEDFRPFAPHVPAGKPAFGPAQATPLLAAYKPLGPEARAMQRLELQRIEIITGEPVASADAGRLAVRLEADAAASPTVARLPDLLRAAGFALSPAFNGQTTRNAVHAA